jgi:hypothetical protein
MKKSKNYKGFSKRLSCFIFLLVTFLYVLPQPVSAQVVSPVQGGHFMPGVMNVRDMAYPPPGLFVLWYNVWFSSDTYVDRNGNEVKSLNLSNLQPGLPDVDISLKVNGYASVPALFWGSSFTLLGGARYLVGISPNYTTADASVLTETGGGIIGDPVTNFEKGNIHGFSDLYVVPAALSWGFKQTDLGIYYGFYAPTGRYETGGDNNLGLGFWTHQFQGFGYFYPVSDRSTALMLGLTYELNSKIKDADVRVGNRFSLEWGISQYLSEAFELSVQGGHNWQVSDDTGEDVFWDPSIHDRKSTIAFSAGWWPWKNKLNVQLKYGFDFGARQRFKANIWTLNLIFITNALTGSK